jgi:cytochrome c-type biogenesis protein CcmE
MTRKQKRMATIAGLGAVLVVAAGLVLFALRDQIVFFYSPSEVAERHVAAGTAIRLGGLVKAGSWTQKGEINDFVVTDGTTDVPARYVGILPDLFREGQGVVAEGSLAPDGSFAATTVLAKHDENYMPKEVVEALKARGEWQRDGAVGAENAQ